MSQQIPLEIVSQNVEKFNFPLEMRGFAPYNPYKSLFRAENMRKGSLFGHQTLF